MVKKAHSPEQIIHKLRQAEVHLSQGSNIGEASRKIGITQQEVLFYKIKGYIGYYAMFCTIHCFVNDS